jgi:hypothetical protein
MAKWAESSDVATKGTCDVGAYFKNPANTY